MDMELANMLYRLKLKANRQREYGVAFVYSEAEQLVYGIPATIDDSCRNKIKQDLDGLKLYVRNEREQLAWDEIFSLYCKCFAL